MQAIEQLFEGIVTKNRRSLSKAITIIESNLPQDSVNAQRLIQLCLNKKSSSLRIGISGIPGVGKSTFIDTFGSFVCAKGKSIAVLAVDPSSSISKGSILGDKTRMSSLSQFENCFIRPSPSGGSLGGVTRKMRETILLCEAAGYDYIMIETVGVGQNEISVRSMTDLFLLLMIAGAGDELQGFKRGITEISDIILVNKADGDSLISAKLSKAEYARAIQFLTPSTQGWKTIVETFSSLDSTNCEVLFQQIIAFEQHIKSTGIFEERRKIQELEWFEDLLQKEIVQYFLRSNNRKSLVESLKSEISNGTINATIAMESILKTF
jgi:LAO/AO transport system kinase